ncbi:MAG: hypothetical protein ACRD2L_06225 [Terriglobia bacterium]
MKPRILQLLVLVLLVGTWGFAEALEPLKPYDNFEQALINPDKWVGSQFEAPPRVGGSFLELVRKTTQEEHHLRILNRSVGQTFFNGGISLSLFRLGFTRPDSITAIRSRVQVRNAESTGCPDALNPTPTLATAQIFGFFFNTNATVPGNGTNDVIAGVQVQRRSDSTDPPDILEISYFVSHCLDPDCVGISPLGGGVLGTVKTGEWVRLLLQWDRDRFIFQRDREQPVFVTYTGFSDAAPPGIQLKTLGADHFIANCAANPRPVGMVDALFDNVFVNQSALH